MNNPIIEYRCLNPFETYFKSMTFPSLSHLVASSKHGDTNIISLGCFYENTPAGLILCTYKECEAQIQSIFIEKKFRDRGLSGNLIFELLKLLKKRYGNIRVTCVFQQNRNYSKVINHLLDKQGFSKGDTRCLIFRCGPNLKNLPWLKRYNYTPHGFRIIPWNSLSPNQLSHIEDHVKNDPAFPLELDPFRELHIMEPTTTVVLLKEDNTIAGWSMSHRIKTDTIRYSAIYVKKDIQGAGLAIILLMNSIARQVLTNLLDTVPYGIFAVYRRTPMMLKMCKKRFAPYSDSVSESVERSFIIK